MFNPIYMLNVYLVFSSKLFTIWLSIPKVVTITDSKPAIIIINNTYPLPFEIFLIGVT